MSYRLPPLHTLRSFEAVSRLGSFTAAAHELHVTVSAISHQIRTLEAFYQLQLLRRMRRQAVATPAGERLLAAVRPALLHLTHVTEDIRPGHGRSLQLSVLPSFASRWLMARLNSFTQRHPHVGLRLHATQALTDLHASGMHVAIRYGHGDWPGVHVESLFEEQVFPVANAQFVRHHRIRRVQDLSRCPLLQDEFQPWDPWLQAAGLSNADCTFGAWYGDSALLLQAAENGQGVALARSWLAADALRRGTLVRIFALGVPARGKYFLAFPTHAQTAAARSFGGWLRDVGGDQGKAP